MSTLSPRAMFVVALVCCAVVSDALPPMLLPGGQDESLPAERPSALSSAPPAFACIEGALPGDSVVLPSSPMYNDVRLPFNLAYSDRYPGLIVRPTTAKQVQATVKCIGDDPSRPAFRVRGGGHSYAGFSAPQNGTILIDVGALNQTAVCMTNRDIDITSDGASIESASTQVIVGAGIRLGDLYDTLWDHSGLMVSAGTCRHVGAGGHGQGGGFGYISRTFGLFSDRIAGYSIVLANGELVNATASNYPDLYWALRGGGGGNFGVVTSFTLDPIVKMPSVVRFNGTAITLPKAAAKFFFDLQEVVPNMDPRLNMAASFAVDVGVQIDGHFVNGTEAELKALLSTCSALAKFDFKFYSGVYYKDLTYDNGPNQAPHGFIATSKWIYEDAPLPLTSFEKLFDAAVLHLKPFWGIQFHAYGKPSAVNQIAENATAFAFRDTLWSVQMAGNFKPSQRESHVAGFKAFRDVANEVFDTGAYRCYPDALLSADEYMGAYYRGNTDRLRQVKLLYDPNNMFKFEQSIV
eukprot:m.134700 g.134700  ORF g.134700 m.134700 type:complete len:521 (+) comp29753_c0_seq1:198-1760(+)